MNNLDRGTVGRSQLLAVVGQGRIESWIKLSVQGTITALKRHSLASAVLTYFLMEHVDVITQGGFPLDPCGTF